MLQRRWQRGAVYLRRGKKISMWYGRWWEDSVTAEGTVLRRYRKVRLGTQQEIPTKNQAREALSRLISPSSKPKTAMKFRELVGRWERLVLPTFDKASTAAHYQHALRPLMPIFGDRESSEITAYDVQAFISDATKRYSRSTLRSLRTAMSIVFEWAILNKWREGNPCSGTKLPRADKCGGRRVQRRVLTADQVITIISRLEEPYATLVLLLSVTGVRICEAIAIKWSDFEGDILKVQRRIYDGEADAVKTQRSNRSLPMPRVVLERMRALGEGEWIFRSEAGTPLNPKNTLNRYIRPVVAAMGIEIGGFHDFRHTLTTKLRRGGVHPKVISGLLGHAKVDLAMNVYDHLEAEELREPLAQIAMQLNPIEPKLENVA